MIHFTLIIAFVIFLSINVISANEINENSLDSIDSSNLIGIDSVENTNYLSSDLTQDQINNLNSISDNEKLSKTQNTDISVSKTNSNSTKVSSNSNQTKTVVDRTINSSSNNSSDKSIKQSTAAVKSNSTQASKKTDITVSKTSIQRGSSVIVYLKDSEGNPIAGKNVTLTINKLQYTKTTNAKGAVSLKFNVLLGKYTLKVHFAGDSEHDAKTSDFLLNIYQENTKITISSASVYRGKYLFAFLKDSAGNPISNHKLGISLNGKKYTRITNRNGRIGLKIIPAAGKYTTKVVFAGTIPYAASSKSFTLNVYKQATKIIVESTNVVRGKYIFAYLKTADGVAIKGQKITIRFNNINFYCTSNRNGRVGLQIKTKLGTFPTTIRYNGNANFKACSKSVNIKSFIDSTKFTVPNASIIRGKSFIAILRDSSNKAIANQKVIASFGDKKYTRTTNSKGQIELVIVAPANNYSVKLSYAGTNSYGPSTRSITLHVLPNVTAVIIAKKATCLGDYSVRLTDLNGKPIPNQLLKIVATTNHAAGSLKKITQKTVIIDTDIIYNNKTDTNYMKSIASILKSKGYKVIISSRGPNAHCDDIMGKYSNAVILCLFGGADSGMFKDMSDDWYQNLLKKYNNRVVLGFLDPPNTVDLATCKWLPRAHDDDYSPNSFTGLNYPGNYLNNHGMDYIYGRNPTEMANNFLKYAVNGLSIGLKNKIPYEIKVFNVETNENGYATIVGLSPGTYTVVVSLGTNTLGYLADSVTTTIVVI